MKKYLGQLQVHYISRLISPLYLYVPLSTNKKKTSQKTNKNRKKQTLKIRFAWLDSSVAKFYTWEKRPSYQGLPRFFDHPDSKARMRRCFLGVGAPMIIFSFL